MSFIAFLILGLIVGAIAKSMLGEGAGWFLTLVLGVLGAMVGGWLGGILFGVELGSFFSLWTWLLAIIGAVLVFLVYGALRR
ncbi:GlsB/YeaQ/YmgE family stress response membrane protein [Cellulomonas sp. P22]|uniref:GlsB/YeaQ/YmgE family stress response membrane protein n=1 Tax=Cellulomonas sp. P22 TaxID=3373189 RepID=UPI003792036F